MSPPSLSRRNVILLIVASLTSLLFLGSLLSSSHFPMSTDFHSLHHIFSPPPYPWLSPSYPHNRPRMIIMQHFSWHDARAHRMQDASIAQHERYTHFWGYGYVKSDRQYVEGWRHERLRYMNKMYALLGVVLEQQAMGDEGAEWIYMTDADVMIRNPQIPVHALLPLSPSHTNATVVGCEDWNGFNAGNIIYRVSLETIAFLSHVLALTDEQTRAYIAAGSPVPPDPEGEGTDPDQIPGQVDGVELPPSDQRAQCLVLERMEAYGNRFYAMPDEWLNAYPWYDRNELQLNTHFVGGNKYTDDVDNYVELEKAQLRMLKSMSKGEVRQEEQKWAELAGQYWAGVRVGAPKCDWI